MLESDDAVFKTGWVWKMCVNLNRNSLQAKQIMSRL